MESPNVQLSPHEMALVQDAEIILTKNSIIQKSIAMMQNLQDQMQTEALLQSKDVLIVAPKISKGENYLGLPYVVLDYPRLSSGRDLCFIRSMFWWGHFFSSTLQLSGRFQLQNADKLSKAYSQLCLHKYFIGVNNDPWQHHFEEQNYQSIANHSEESFSQKLHYHHQIKIAAKWPLTQWNTAATSLFESWKLFNGFIT